MEQVLILSFSLSIRFSVYLSICDNCSGTTSKIGLNICIKIVNYRGRCGRARVLRKTCWCHNLDFLEMCPKDINFCMLVKSIDGLMWPEWLFCNLIEINQGIQIRFFIYLGILPIEMYQCYLHKGRHQ